MCKELLRLLEVHEKQPATVAAIFFALRAIACNDDAVQQVYAASFILICLSLIAYAYILVFIAYMVVVRVSLVSFLVMPSFPSPQPLP